MSNQADRQIFYLQKLRKDLLSARWKVDGIELDKSSGSQYRDIRLCAEAYTLYAALLSDLVCADIEAIVKYVYRLSSLDVADLARRFKNMDALLSEYFETRSDISPECLILRFKHAASENWLIRPVFTHICHFANDGTVQAFRVLHQAFTFLSRLSLDCSDRQAAIDEFLNRNNGPLFIDTALARRLRPILQEMLRGLELIPWGKHGPGSTADAGRVDGVEKTLFLHPDSIHELCFRRAGWNIDDYMPFTGIRASCSTNRTVKLTTVPKTALKRRVIAMETVTQQWFQQLVKGALYHHIGCRIRSIPIRDQQIQRDRARIGSISGYYATIDLSAASDSVSWTLVKEAFCGTGLLFWLYGVRSTTVQYAKTKSCPLNMFATMGSGVCFPIESLIFDAVCRLASRDLRIPYDCTVYGDDIICPSRAVELICDYLTRLGFTVNYDKSFTNLSYRVFRESCGGEFLGGDDVTSIKLPRKFCVYDTGRHPTSFLSWIDLCNEAHDRGYYRLRQWLIWVMLHDQAGIKPPFGSVRTGFIHTDDVPTNYLCRHRWNPDLQRKEVEAGSLRVMAKTMRYILSTNWLHSGSQFQGAWSIIENDPLYPQARDTVDHLRYFLWWSEKGRERVSSFDNIERFDPYTVDAGLCHLLENKWHREI